MRIFFPLKGPGMGTMIIVTAVVGFVLLLIATTALVTLNWSERTLAPVLSILLVGVATTLAAVLVSLLNLAKYSDNF